MPPTNIEVRLKITPDTKAASNALRGLNGDVSNLSKSAAEAKKRLSLDTNAGDLKKGEDAKEPGKAGAGGEENEAKKESAKSFKALAMKAAAVVAAFTAVAKAAGAGATAFYEGKSTNGVLDAALKNTPIVGGAYSGMKGGIASTIYSKSMASANIEDKFNYLQENRNAIYSPIDALKAGVKATNQQQANRAAMAQAEGPDRAGNRAKYGERFEDSFNSAEAEANKARRELEIARKNAGSSAGDLAKESRVSKGFGKLVDEAKGDVKNAENGAAEIAARSRLSTAESNLARQLEQEKAAGERHAKAALDVVAKLQESLNAENSLISAKRDRAKALLDETKAGAASFLSTTQEDKYMLAASLRQLKEGGSESLAPEQLQQLLGNGLTGEFAKKEILKNAGNDPLLNSILQDTGRGSIQDQERQVQALNAELDVKMKLDQTQIEEALRKALAEAGLNAEEIASKIGDRAAREIDNKMQQKNLGEGMGVR